MASLGLEFNTFSPHVSLRWAQSFPDSSPTYSGDQMAITECLNIIRYNSVVFKAIDANDYEVLIILEDFLSGAPFSDNIAVGYSSMETNEKALTPRLQRLGASFNMLENDQCISAYSERFLSGRRSLLLFTDGVYDSHSVSLNSSLIEMFPVTPTSATLASYDPLIWLCSSQDNDFLISCDTSKLNTKAWTIHKHKIKYCRSEIIEEKCQLQFSQFIGIMVVVCNAIKFCCMSMTAFMLNQDTMCTIG